MTSLPQARRFDWTNLGLRVVSALVLVPAVVGAIMVEANWPYLVLISIAVALLAIEWGGMSAPRAPLRVSAAVTAAVLTALFLTHLQHPGWAWAAMIVGAAAAALVARGVAERPADAAFGVIYLAPAAVCLAWLRLTHQGQWWTLMLFLVTWVGRYRRLRGRQRPERPQALAAVLAEQDLVGIHRRPGLREPWSGFWSRRRSSSTSPCPAPSCRCSS
jgi:hypothetical protein